MALVYVSVLFKRYNNNKNSPVIFNNSIHLDLLFTDCGSSISNCIECALNGENVACSECSDTYFPAELDGIAAAQCARMFTYNNSLFTYCFMTKTIGNRCCRL